MEGDGPRGRASQGREETHVSHHKHDVFGMAGVRGRHVSRPAADAGADACATPEVRASHVQTRKR
eukprot:scaffold261_cov336-Pavlova_lutheri.AAC.43